MTAGPSLGRRASSLVRGGLAALVLAPIWVYRNAISPMTPRTCRFYPSCSAYAEQAVKTHGAFRGSWLALRRLARCHPWTPGGVDHVPPAKGHEGHEGHDLQETQQLQESKQNVPASPVTGV